MIFSSWQFILVFLPLAVVVYLAIPTRWGTARKLWLALSSFVFYGYWRIDYIPLLVFSILFNYVIAEWIFRKHGRSRTGWVLFAGVAVNLGLLGYYKYADFLINTCNAVSSSELGVLNLILPLAISFFTFTQIAYLVDVYRDQAKHYSFLDYSLFVVFFPHLIAGPIVRHWEIIPQYSPKTPRFSAEDFSIGLAIFLIGLYKKLLLADPVSQVADSVYGASSAGHVLTWFDAWFGTLAYTLQIYFDFSGYSDMAIGLARMFSIKFPVNFNSPYKAGSITEFWRSWHITLMRFFREYLYIPLGGNRCGKPRHYTNIFAVFLFSGLWHGAGWTFVAWGALHGVYSVIHASWVDLLRRLGFQPTQYFVYRLGAVGVTFVAVACSWVLFRAHSFREAASILSSMLGLNGFTVPFNIGEAELGLGRLFSAMGASIVSAEACIEGLSYAWSIHGVIALLAMVWLLPNTQQLLARLAPILEKVDKPARWQLRLSFTGGLVLALPLVLVLRTFLGTQVSPFLYFNF
jgi:D-alanyl-lipoteichoic acid acyltransferase DltB (MBOAT superfamily)